jgi:23S rRNA pseudouridine1911/1915/1917 synthase
MKHSLDIIYEDDSLVALNKPAGLLSIPDRHDPEKPSLYQMLLEKYGDILIVHRLDKGTSGLIVYARTPEAHRHLSLQFEQREVQKIYLALVEGIPFPSEGTIEKALAPHPTQAGKMIVSNKGKAALTHYQVTETFRSYAAVEVDIQTGRTHQIRVHMSAIGHPVLADPLYSQREAFYLSEIKGRRFNLGKEQEERPLLERPALHAARLTLQHPATGREIVLEAPLPKDMRATLNQLRKWNG